ncbi:hypothetical protein IAD21_03418 [Abditibacteriota bacterium]|nr:hypothetical protein IAD21_03418 [Abditibacteriota bacterium]
MRRAFTLLEALIIFVVLAVIAAFLWPVFGRRPEPDHRNRGCYLNLRQIGLGFLQYAEDYNKFPPARVTASTGWADALQPYVKSRQLFSCPMTKSYSSSASDYFYNRQMARVASDRVDEPAKTILTGEGNDNAPTWNSWVGLPADAATNSNSPSQRHREGANYGFSDGHVKWIKPGDLPARAEWKPRLF